MFASTYRKARNFTRYIFRNILYLSKRLRVTNSLDIKGKDVILFYLPSGEWISGGILSIFFLIDNSVKIRPDAVVIPFVLTKLQRYFKTSWFKSPFFIFNALDIKGKLRQSSNMVIHVPECLSEQFFDSVKKYSLEDITRRATINILNQNDEAMPMAEVFYQNKSLCGKLTMTLAFEANQTKSYPFLDMHQITLSTWFYRDKNVFSDFEKKEDICIISPDYHPLKDKIVNKIRSEMDVQCIEIRNMPFDDYRILRAKAKWAVSFGEGYDAYFAGTIANGGMGFGVDQDDFRPPFIGVDNLPENAFCSYEDMFRGIVERMKYFAQHPDQRLILGKKLAAGMAEISSPELVSQNLDNYYKAIGI